MRHWTDRRGEKGILADGVVQPARVPILQEYLSFWTDLDEHDARLLGMDRRKMKTAVFALDGEKIVPWSQLARRFDPWRIDKFVRPGSDTSRWFVSLYPVRVLTDALRWSDVKGERGR